MTASPTAEAKAADGDDRRRRDEHGEGHGDAAGHGGRGQVPDRRGRDRGQSARTGKITLTAEVTGTPKLALATADQRLDVTGQVRHEQRIPMVVGNTGTAPLDAT